MKEKYDKIAIIPYYDEKCIIRIKNSHMEKIITNLTKQNPGCKIKIITYYGKDYRVLSNNINPSDYDASDIEIVRIYNKKNTLDLVRGKYVFCCVDGILDKNVTQIPISDYYTNDYEDNGFLGCEIINMLPYRDNNPELLMSKEQILSIIDAIQYKYENAVINIIPLTDAHYNKISPFIRGKRNILINRINNLLDIISITNNEEILVVNSRNSIKDCYFKDNNLRIIYAEDCINYYIQSKMPKKYFILPVYCVLFTLNKHSEYTLKNIIDKNCSKKDEIVIGYDKFIRNYFMKKWDEYIKEISEFIKNNYDGWDIRIEEIDKDIKDLNNDDYTIICNKHTMNCFGLNEDKTMVIDLFELNG